MDNTLGEETNYFSCYIQLRYPETFNGLLALMGC